MSYQRILTVQDISCVGQCSLTVALPILSACGLETCILPSAVLSTHTGGFRGFTFRDLTDDIPSVCDHWRAEGLTFDAIYTGYLGSTRQIDMVKHMMQTLVVPGGKRVVDPAMADNGRLYTGFDQDYVTAMRGLCACADVILPNITEACMMTEMEYAEQYDEAYISALLEALSRIGAPRIVLTGVSYHADTLGVVVYENGKAEYCPHRRIAKMFHGTGDIFASAFTGAWVQGRSLRRSAEIAAEFTLACIENTLDAPEHWYGVRFEPCLPKLCGLLSEIE